MTVETGLVRTKIVLNRASVQLWQRRSQRTALRCLISPFLALSAIAGLIVGLATAEGRGSTLVRQPVEQARDIAIAETVTRYRDQTIEFREKPPAVLAARPE